VLLKHFEKAIRDRQISLGTQLLQGSAESYDKYMWHVGYSVGMLDALALLKEIVDADSDSEE
jgi:hypothetical protein